MLNVRRDYRLNVGSGGGGGRLKLLNVGGGSGGGCGGRINLLNVGGGDGSENLFYCCFWKNYLFLKHLAFFVCHWLALVLVPF